MYLDRYFEARNLILAAKREQLETLRDLRFNHSYVAYLNEFGTIKMAFGRRTGGTYWALHAAHMFSEEMMAKNDAGKVVLLLPFQRLYHQLAIDYSFRFGTRFPDNICAISQPNQIRGLDVRYLIVEVSCFFGKNFLDQIYANLMNCELIIQI